MIEIKRVMQAILCGHIRKGNRGYVRIGKDLVEAEILDVRDGIIRVHCDSPPALHDGAAVLLEFRCEEPSGVAAYYARVLTASPDAVHEMVLLRSASLNREELRANLRVPTDIALSIHTNGHAQPLHGRLLNISAGGAYVETSSPLTLNGRSRVTLKMVDEPALQVHGEVIHAGESDTGTGIHRCGVRFSNIEPENARAISWYVWSRVRSFFQENG